MTTLKLNSTLRLAIFAFFFLNLSVITSAQDTPIRLSGAAGVGYAPLVSLGNTDYSGVVTSIYGELEYGNLIGRLQYSKAIMSTFGSDRLEDGNAYHGSLGYRIDLQEKLSLAIMLSGGATVTTYSVFSDNYTNVSPQVGINAVPTFQISKTLSIQASLRYYKGFEAGDRGDASDLLDFGVGLRISL